MMSDDMQSRIVELEEELYVIKSILNQLPLSVYWKNMDGVYLGQNQFAADLMKEVNFEEGTTVDSVIGKTDFDLFPEDVANVYRENDLEVIRSKKEKSVEESVQTPSHKLVQLSTKTPLYDKNKNIIGVLGVTKDITEKKRADQLKKELEIQEEATARTKMWASAIAHEVRTPLANLGLNLSMMGYAFEGIDENSSKEDLLKAIEDLKTAPEKITKCLDRARNVIDMTLMKAKSDSIKDVALTPTSLKSAVETALNEYPFQVGERERIHVDIAEGIQINSQQEYFDHLIFNFVKNSLYYIKAAQKGEIFISAHPKGNDVVFIFKDTAAGVDEEALSNFFTPFFTKSRNGTGVGLNLIKNIVEAFGGSIKAESEEGEHMTFEMRFPIP